MILTGSINSAKTCNWNKCKTKVLSGANFNKTYFFPQLFVTAPNKDLNIAEKMKHFDKIYDGIKHKAFG